MRYCLVLIALLFCMSSQAIDKFTGVFVTPAQAQNAEGHKNLEVRLEPSQVEVGENFQVIVSVNDPGSVSVSKPTLEASNTFEAELTGQSRSTQIINGNFSSSLEFSFTLAAKKKLAEGKYKVPFGRIVIDGETVRFSIPDIEIKKPTLETDSKADISQLVSNKRPYIGEQIVYSLEILSKNQFRKASLNEVQLKGFWRESLGRLSQTNRRIDNRGTTRHSVREVLFPLESGKVEIPVRKLTASVPKKEPYGRRPSPLGSPWSNSRFSLFRTKYVTRHYMSRPIEIEVKPLPLYKGAQPSADIPVGSLEAKLAAPGKEFLLGDSIEMTLKLSGTANLRPLKLEKLLKGKLKNFRFYPGEEVVSPKWDGDKINFNKTFKFSLVPTRTGVLSIPEIDFLYFEPDKEEYLTASTKAFSLVVRPGNEKDLSSSDKNLLESSLEDDLSSNENESTPEVAAEDKALSPLSFKQPLANRFFGPLVLWSLSLFTLVATLLSYLLRKTPAQKKLDGLLSKLRAKNNHLSQDSRTWKETLPSIRSLLSEVGNLSEPESCEKLKQQIDNILFSPNDKGSEIDEFSKHLSDFLAKARRTRPKKVLNKQGSLSVLFFLSFFTIALPVKAEATAPDIDVASTLDSAREHFRLSNFEEAGSQFAKLHKEKTSVFWSDYSSAFNAAKSFELAGKPVHALAYYLIASNGFVFNQEIRGKIKELREELGDSGDEDPLANRVINFLSLEQLALGSLLLTLSIAFLSRDNRKHIPKFLFFLAILLVSLTTYRSALRLSAFGILNVPGFGNLQAISLTKETPVYSEPNSESQVVDTISRGEEIRITQQIGESEWFQIELSNNRSGWLDDKSLILIR